MIKLTTPRLLLRRWTADDLEPLLAILGDPTTMAFWPRPFDRGLVADWIATNQRRYAERGYGRMALLRRADNLLIGDVGVMDTTLDGADVHDLGYIVHAAHWGQGYAGEAAAAMRDAAFGQLALPALHANMAHDHLGSQRVAERIGMTFVRAFDNPRNRGIRTLIYQIERAAWAGVASPAPKP